MRLAGSIAVSYSNAISALRERGRAGRDDYRPSRRGAPATINRCPDDRCVRLDYFTRPPSRFKWPA